MTLSFAAATDHVDHGSGSNIDNLAAFTIILWTYPTDETGPKCLLSKAVTTGVGAGSARVSIERQFGDVDDYEIIVGRATTTADVLTVNVNRPLNRWKYLSITYSDSESARVWHGDEIAPVTEAAYAGGSVTGSGARGDDSAYNLYCGSRDDGGGEGFTGDIFGLAVYPYVLTPRAMERHRRWWAPQTGCRLFARYGRHDANTQVDESGWGNHGTVSGATLSRRTVLLQPDTRGPARRLRVR